MTEKRIAELIENQIRMHKTKSEYYSGLEMEPQADYERELAEALNEVYNVWREQK